MAVTVADWVLTTLRAALPADVLVYDGAVPGIPSSRYVVLWAGSGLRTASGVDSASRDVSHRFQVTSVCSRPDSAASDAPLTRWLSAKVRDALTDARPDVDGLACGLIQHTDAQPPVVDELVKDRPTVFAADVFELLADRL